MDAHAALNRPMLGDKAFAVGSGVEGCDWDACSVAVEKKSALVLKRILPKSRERCCSHPAVPRHDEAIQAP